MTERVALITGGGRGIGLACAQSLALLGYRVAIHYRSSMDGAQKIVHEHPKCRAFQADLSSALAAETLIKIVKSEMGAIDILVNNAGITADQILPFAKPEDYDAVMNTNMRSVFILCKHASKVMMRQRFGRIINMSSVVGHTGNPGQSVYAASKGALTAFTKSIAIELASFGVTANCIAPGFITTDMTASIPAEARALLESRIPMKREGTADEIAHAVEFLASDRAAYITGSTIHVNGGLYLS